MAPLCRGRGSEVAGSRRPPVVWHYQPGAQQRFLQSTVFETGIEGNRGGGKTDALLMDFAQHVGRGFGASWRGVLFRRTYPELEDVISKTQRWFPRMFPSARFVGSPNPGWYFADGEVLLLRQIEREQDYWKYHGHEYPWIGFEELTTWPLDVIYRRMFTCCRSSHPDVPLKIRSTFNPSGPGHNWVKKRFGLPVPPGRTIGRLIQRAGEKPRVAIHSDLKENVALLSSNPGYQQQILMGAKNDAERRAWQHGDWNIIAGGMFDDVWRPEVHVVPSFPVRAIPRGWRIDRSYDHGSSKPFSVGWHAESNGEPFEWGGRLLGTMPGDVFRIAEWYGSPSHSNEGLRLTARQIADGIIDREQDMGLWGLVKPGPADSQIFSPGEPGRPSVHEEFLKVGVSFEPADKGPGSRKAGWELMRQMLIGAIVPITGYREDPGYFICDRCFDAIEKLPVAPRDQKDPDDVDTESEDHILDEIRYRLRRRASGMTKGSWR